MAMGGIFSDHEWFGQNWGQILFLSQGYCFENLGRHDCFMMGVSLDFVQSSLL